MPGIYLKGLKIQLAIRAHATITSQIQKSNKNGRKESCYGLSIKGSKC